MTTLRVYVGGIATGLESSRALQERLDHEPGRGNDKFRDYENTVTAMSTGRLQDHARRLAAQIDSWDEDGFDRITLIGNSIGGLLVRYAYLYGAGALPPEPRRPWASKVDRIVLLGTPNRGFRRESL